MKDFSIIIPTYKDWDRLSLCIECLLNQESDDVKFEIIVVDNDTEHNIPSEFLRARNDVLKIVHERKPGSYAARNYGAALAKGKYFAFTDSDCLPDSKWLMNAKKVFTQIDCDLIGGRVDIFKPEGGGEWAYIYEKCTSFRQHIHVKNGRSVTANLFVRNNVFNSLRGFDNVKSGGDWEFTERAVKKGHLMLYGDDVVVKHPARKTVKKILKKQKRFAAWGYLNVKNRYGHSGLRILGSNLLRGTPSALKRMKLSDNPNEKLIILIISIRVHFHKLFYQTLFLLKILNPDRIRD